MTSEEMEKILQQMLAVQQELQNSHLQFRESLFELREDIDNLRASVADLREISATHERRIQQLVGYSITSESDRLDLLQRLQNLERRVSNLENDS